MKIHYLAAAAAGLVLAAAPAVARADENPVLYDVYRSQSECAAEGRLQVSSGAAEDFFCEKFGHGWDLYLWV